MPKPARLPQAQPLPADGLLTTAQAAEILDVERVTVGKHITRGNLPARRVGHMFLILISDLLKFRRERRKPGRPPKNQSEKK